MIKQLNKQSGPKKPVDPILNRYPIFKKKPYQHKPHLIELELPKQKGVEQAVADYYLRQNPNNHCYFAENSLFTGVLGLLRREGVDVPAGHAPREGRQGNKKRGQIKGRDTGWTE